MHDNETQSIENRLLSYLREHAGIHGQVDAQTNLLDSGVLDSLLITDLVLFTQVAFGVELTAHDISPEHLCSVQSMARLIRDKRQKGKQAA